MIRDAQAADMQAIMDIYNEEILTATTVYAYQKQTLDQRMEWFENKLAAGFPVIVDVTDGVLRGFASYGPFRAFPAYKYTVEHLVYVAKPYRQLQLGTLLITELLKLATRQGMAMMVGAIDSANVPSIKAHEKLGFAYAGTIHRAGYKFGKWLDLNFYEYTLNGPDMPVED